jgi:hypothetical protein
MGVVFQQRDVFDTEPKSLRQGRGLPIQRIPGNSGEVSGARTLSNPFHPRPFGGYPL